MFKRIKWIKIADNIILFSVLYLIFWCHYFLLPGSEHGVGRDFFVCKNAAFVTPGRFDNILPSPHEDEQEQRLSSASIKFLWLRQIHDLSGI